MVRLKGLDLRCGEGRLGLQSAPALCRVPSCSSPMGKRESRLTAGLFLVRLKGLEPTHISVREPKSRMSTNSITGAKENPAAAAAGCGAGNEARTRYLHLGKVALYRMSYARVSVCYFTTKYGLVKCFRAQLPKAGKAGRIPKLRPRYLHRQGK